MIPVKIKRLHPDAVIPQYATAGSAGFDLVAVEDVAISPGETWKVPLGLAFEIPEGFVMLVCMRSGIAYNTELRQPNGIGIIDSDYRGEVAMMFDNIWKNEPFFAYDEEGRAIVTDYRIEDECPSTEYLRTISGEQVRQWRDYPAGTYLIRKGDRVAQGLILPVMQAQFIVADELSETERGVGGFGSTGVVMR
ncbi:deoxyuridine 5'-triphosphate nucleotidohydrolase [Brevibacillus laterosporus]|uniref:dUTP diphosphatase n=1 Tax=Bacillales TaxID=1385 RepID=UPI000F8E6103|nr:MULTISPECIES: deoxyuridine 5'-triphosphate nucleotidohydrolase [Bacillales]MCR8938768.1 deoxyuridine 5'-triphosphate nucleotidohydrolase [Brevibacillus laterosporus]MCZ0841408.1 deoxyuridine 5'-triphosphate nucleotidohydrolase [Brevibacillus laterosporus]MCZ0847726.1 deoxyuridine 5'-triphosphate nucleotidohydrolase [Brevibacillus laterosporus]RUR59886.1 deoxyuridine 5'-triphosphate nucleotidohydrolase [Bacillus sp. VKPM B-3276]